MDCPVDGEPMVALALQDIEIDYCVACGGIWLDAGELELLFGDAQGCHALLGAPSGTAKKEKKRKCPLCRSVMDKREWRGVEDVILDQCPQGDGLWLDAGELEAVLRDADASGPGKEVATLLKEMFAAVIDTSHGPENKVNEEG